MLYHTALYARLIFLTLCQYIVVEISTILFVQHWHCQIFIQDLWLDYCINTQFPWAQFATFCSHSYVILMCLWFVLELSCGKCHDVPSFWASIRIVSFNSRLMTLLQFNDCVNLPRSQFSVKHLSENVLLKYIATTVSHSNVGPYYGKEDLDKQISKGLEEWKHVNWSVHTAPDLVTLS